jgi:PAS domain S-box-containing protein
VFDESDSHRGYRRQIEQIKPESGANSPLAAASAEALLHPAMTVSVSTRSHPLPRLRALVVEDSEDDFELLIASLGKGPWRVEARRVENEPGLREALAEGGWDIVISDHNLPRFDSGAALRLVREARPDTPFIIVSGRIGEDVAVDAMLAGADDYVMKNNMARLRPAIERALARAELRRQKLEAEARQRETESRLEAIAAHLPGVVFQLRQPGPAAPPTFVYLSEGTRSLLGNSPAELLARPERIDALTANAPGEPLLARIAASGRSGQPVAWEGRVGTRDSQRWVSVSASPRPAGEGARLWDGIMVDVTALKQAESRLRELTAEWEKRMDEERAAIARELHDDVGGTLTALKVDIDWLRRRAGENAEIRTKTAGMELLADALIAAIRRLAGALRPGLLDLGIAAAIREKAAELSSRLGIPCHFRSNTEEPALSRERSIALLRVLQEALTNVTKHARASRVDIELFATPREVSLEVRDDGQGFAPEDLGKADSFGVRGMHERLRRLGGWVEVTSAPGGGTTVMAGLPRA